MQNFDVVIIGGGLTGIGAALKLAKSNVNVALLEAHEIGAGASGRNGGLVCSGYRHDQIWLEEKMGKTAAHELWDISQGAKKHLENTLSENKINADYEKGLLFCAHNKRMFDWLQSDMAHLQNQYSYNDLETLDETKCNQAISTNDYKGGVLDKGVGRIHPLKLLYGMAEAAIKNGAIIYEKCRAIAIEENSNGIKIIHENGYLNAKNLLICGGGYLHGINQEVEAKVLPISSFVIATEKLDFDLMPNAIGAMDTKFVVNYFQKTFDNRLLFGGGEKYTPNWPKDIAGFVRKNLLKIYPQLENVKIEHAWGGALGITPTRLPFVRKIGKSIYSASGYSGQGVLLAPFFGDILGQMLLGDAKNFEILSKMPVPDFPGGRMFRFPLLTAAMSYYSILDKLP